MKRQILGLASALLLLGSGATFAYNEGAGTGGSAAVGKMTEVAGAVVKADKKTVYLEREGAVIPVKVDDHTKFEGSGISGTKDLREGELIKINLAVENKTENRAVKIWKDAGTGGSGSSTLEQISPPAPPATPPRTPASPSPSPETMPQPPPSPDHSGQY